MGLIDFPLSEKRKAIVSLLDYEEKLKEESFNEVINFFSTTAPKFNTEVEVATYTKAYESIAKYLQFKAQVNAEIEKIRSSDD